MSYYGSEYWDAVRKLQAAYPASAPIRVRTVDKGELFKRWGHECFGDYVVYERHKKVAYYLIRIARGLDLNTFHDTICHEMAHVLDIDSNPRVPREHHGNSWGVWKAKLYRVLTGQHGNDAD